MKLPKRMINDILRLTKTTPQDLYNWIENSYNIRKMPKNIGETAVCILIKPNGKYNKYMDKYYFHLDSHISEADQNDIYIKDYKKFDIYEVWYWLCKSEDNYNQMMAEFREAYLDV